MAIHSHQTNINNVKILTISLIPIFHHFSRQLYIKKKKKQAIIYTLTTPSTHLPMYFLTAPVITAGSYNPPEISELLIH